MSKVRLKLRLYRSLLNVDEEKLNRSDIEILYVLSKDEDVRKKLDKHEPKQIPA